MNGYKYKHSILVPTHQRGELLRATLRGLLLQEYDDYQIVVSNNFSQDETRSILEEFKQNQHIKIIHTNQKLSMPDHWEFAMDYVEGEYITILGDDDGVRPEYLSTMDLVIDSTDANLIKFKTGIYYHPDWPNERMGTFEFDTRCTNNYFTVDKWIVISDFCKFKKYIYFPNLMQTCFSHELFRRAKVKCKKVFVGAPDWTCSFLMLMDETARLAFVDSTLGFGGRSQMSNAAWGNSRAGTQNDRITDFFAELTLDTRLPFHQPQISTQSNYHPAAFSYAKNFYPNELREYSLSNFELCKTIQGDMAEEAVTSRRSFYTQQELEIFRMFINELPELQRKEIMRMAGSFSAIGRLRLMLKWIKRRAIESAPWLLLLRLFKRDANSSYLWDSNVNGRDYSVLNGHDLMKYFSKIVESSDKYSKVKSNALQDYACLVPKGLVSYVSKFETNKGV